MKTSLEIVLPDDLYFKLQAMAMACGQPLGDYVAYVLCGHVEQQSHK